MNDSRKIQDVGETGLIEHLSRMLNSQDDAPFVGDDAAVVSFSQDSGWDLLLASDPVIEGRHFEPGTELKRVGHKAVGRVLSDIAAMGGLPQFLLVNLVLPGAMTLDEVDHLYLGMMTLADAFNVKVAGGDTSSGDRLELHVFGSGRVPSGNAVMRSGAQPGDRLYVTGELGGSLQGHHLDFTPRVLEGCWLRQHALATSMTDVTDGLAADAGHMAAAGKVGFEILADAVPCRTDLNGALHDGEDFELLFTVPAEKALDFEAAWAAQLGLPVTCIGAVIPAPGEIHLKRGAQTERIEPLGFDHFRDRE